MLQTMIAHVAEKPSVRCKGATRGVALTAALAPAGKL
jgi:hypothetical protein